MAATPDALPTDPEDLRQYCAQLLTELGDKQQLIDKLTHQLALFRRYLYGRRSEQLDPAQLLLEFASWVQAQEAAAAPAVPTPASPCCRTPKRAGIWTDAGDHDVGLARGALRVTSAARRR
jgi:hypothetical protein